MKLSVPFTLVAVTTGYVLVWLELNYIGRVKIKILIKIYNLK